MMFSKMNMELSRAIKSKNLQEAFLILFDIEANNTQILKCFELVEDNDLFDVFNNFLRENKEIPDRYLALSSLYFNSQYFWDIQHKSADNENYPLLKRKFLEKEKDIVYQRVVFDEWKRLFNEMIEDKTIYKSAKNKSKFYRWPHEYEEYVIENSAKNLKFLFYWPH